MKRDGYNNSLWQDTNKEENVFTKTLSDNSNFDVVIAGGGITGISTGLQLQKQGKKVLIAEAQNIGFGTTGGTTAHLNNFLDTSYDVIEKKFSEEDAITIARATEQALSLIKNNIDTYQIDCGYKRLPGYVFSEDEEQSKTLESMAEGVKRCGLACSWTDSIPVPITFERSLRIDNQASFHPTRYLQALGKAFLEAGGTILENCRVNAVEEGDEFHTIKTSAGDFSAQHFIYATHIPPGVNLLHFRCAPYRSYAMAIKLNKKEDYPDALVYDMQDPYHYYRTQEVDGELYLIAGGEDHKTGHEENTDQCFRKLEAYLHKYFDIKEISHRWSSQYFEPTDGLAYIGHLPGHSNNMYVATGFGGNGMIYGTIAANLLTDIICGNDNPLIDILDPNRIKMVAGFNNFIKEAADVAGHLVNKILVPAEKLKGLASLAPGQAAIVKYDGQKMAIYKDDNGEIFALHAACTHIKCDVSWNSSERTWDCPCHGSRFSYTGEMLTAPARKDLQPVDITS